MITHNPTDHPYYRTLDPIIDLIADWVKKYRSAAQARDELAQCGPEEVAHLAHDLGVTPEELRELARKGPNAQPLLYKMLSALGIDRHTDTRFNKSLLLRDLERTCFACDNKGRCVHELAGGTAKQHYRDFCPNAYTLDTLIGRPH
jgi:hypothetical protein